MKPCQLRPLARDDRRQEVRFYRRETGERVAVKLVEALHKARQERQHNPAIGSPTLGHTLGIAGLRTWRIDGFPLSFWYFERETHIDVARLVGQRQDAVQIEIAPA